MIDMCLPSVALNLKTATSSHPGLCDALKRCVAALRCLSYLTQVDETTAFSLGTQGIKQNEGTL